MASAGPAVKMTTSAKDTKSLSDYKVGEIVWAKFLKGAGKMSRDFWPAEVTHVEQDGSNVPGDQLKVTVQYYDDETTATITASSDIAPFTDNNTEIFNKQKNTMQGELKSAFDAALFEARQECGSRRQSKSKSAPENQNVTTGDDDDDDQSQTVSQIARQTKKTNARFSIESSVIDFSASSDEDIDFGSGVTGIDSGDDDDDDDDDDELLPSQPLVQQGATTTYTTGEVVWMKVPGYAFWPSKVVKVMTSGGKRKKLRQQYVCKMLEWKPDGTHEEECTIKPQKVKDCMRKYVPNSVEFDELYENARKDRALRKFDNGEAILEAAVQSANASLWQKEDGAETLNDANEKHDRNNCDYEGDNDGPLDAPDASADLADRKLPPVTHTKTATEPIRTEVSKITTIESVVVTHEISRTCEETVEYVQRKVDDSVSCDDEPPSKRSRVVAEIYTEAMIREALANSDLVDRLQKIWNRQLSTERSKQYLSTPQRRRRSTFGIVSYGKIPNQIIQDKQWSVTFDEIVEKTIGTTDSSALAEQRDFFWDVVIQEAVWSVHQVIERVSYDQARTLVNEMKYT